MKKEVLEEAYVSLLAELVEKYQRKLLAYAYQIVNCYAEAEDVVQTAYLAVAKHMDTLMRLTPQERECYLLHAVRNTALTVLKKAQKERCDGDFEVAKEYVADDFGIIPEQQYLREERNAYIYWAIEQLDPIYYDVIVMNYLMEYTVDEIAASLESKRETILTRLSRGRKQLAKLLRESGYYGEY